MLGNSRSPLSFHPNRPRKGLSRKVCGPEHSGNSRHGKTLIFTVSTDITPCSLRLTSNLLTSCAECRLLTRLIAGSPPGDRVTFPLYLIFFTFVVLLFLFFFSLSFFVCLLSFSFVLCLFLCVLFCFFHTVYAPYKTGSGSVCEVPVAIRSIPKPFQWVI